MKTAVLAFTGNGGKTAAKIVDALNKCGHECRGYIYYSFDAEGFIKFDNLSETTGLLFKAYNALVFVSACGIAVRAVAPYLKGKTVDPAVIVVDELGKFTIPILSGHIGGANELAKEISEAISSTPVITTATDINKKFAVDMFAVKNNLYISDMKKAKKISAEILKGHKIGFYSVFKHNNLPDELSEDTSLPLGICVSYNENDQPFAETLNLIPKNIILGIGCRKDIDVLVFDQAVKDALAEHGIPFEAVKSVATIDLKRKEPAFMIFCDRYNLKAEFFPSEALAKAKGDFSGSDFVKQVTGVDNVCERSAVLAAGNDLIFEKQIINGVTLAAAGETVELDFVKENI